MILTFLVIQLVGVGDDDGGAAVPSHPIRTSPSHLSRPDNAILLVSRLFPRSLPVGPTERGGC